MGKNFLEIQNVTFAASKKNKVNNVTLNIENEGDIICLLGPSGIGKTTILRSIAGLERIQSGKILLKNKIISSKNIHIEPEKRNISLSFQDNCLFPHHNVIQNIEFGAEKNKGIRLDGNVPKVVKIGDKWSIDDILEHDESDYVIASLLSNMTYNEDFPDPIGVLYAIEDTTYEDMMVNQIKEATKKKAKGTIQDIINAGDTWVVK